MAVGRVGELEPQGLGVLARLLYARFRSQACLLGLDNSQRKVTPVEQDVVGTALLAALHLSTSREDTAVGEGALLANGERRGRPTSLNDLRSDQFPAGI